MPTTAPGASRRARSTVMVPGPQPTSRRSIPGRASPAGRRPSSRRCARCGCAAPTRGGRGCRCRGHLHDARPRCPGPAPAGPLTMRHFPPYCFTMGPAGRAGSRRRATAPGASSAHLGHRRPLDPAGADRRRRPALHRPPGDPQDHGRRRGPGGRGLPGHPLPGVPRGQGRGARRPWSRPRWPGCSPALAVVMGEAHDLEDVLVAGMVDAARRLSGHEAPGLPARATSPRWCCPTWPSPRWTGCCSPRAPSPPRSSRRWLEPDAGRPGGRVGRPHRALLPVLPRPRVRPEPTPTRPATWSAPS